MLLLLLLLVAPRPALPGLEPALAAVLAADSGLAEVEVRGGLHPSTFDTALARAAASLESAAGDARVTLDESVITLPFVELDTS